MPEPAAIENAVQRALIDLGDAASGPEVAAHVERVYGVKIDPKFLPVYRASIRGRQRLERDRAERRSATAITAPNSSGHPTPISDAIDSAGQTTSDRLAAFGAALTLPDLSQRLDHVGKLARDLMMIHGLSDWSFGYNRGRRLPGLCIYGRRAIELSVHLVHRNGPAEVLDTVLHEIAHALVGPGRGHGLTWKRKCVDVGAVPKRCGPADMPAGRWTAKCGSCGAAFDRHRRPARAGWYCRQCGPERRRLK